MTTVTVQETTHTVTVSGGGVVVTEVPVIQVVEVAAGVVSGPVVLAEDFTPTSETLEDTGLSFVAEASSTYTLRVLLLFSQTGVEPEQSVLSFAGPSGMSFVVGTPQPFNLSAADSPFTDETFDITGFSGSVNGEKVFIAFNAVIQTTDAGAVTLMMAHAGEAAPAAGILYAGSMMEVFKAS